MIDLVFSVEIRRPLPAVFAFAGDYANDPSWRAGVLAMAYERGNAPAVGVRTRETMRSMGSTAVTVAEIVEYSPARTAFRSLSGPVPCEGSREFVATADGTRFTYALTLRPGGFLRLLAPLLRWLFARNVRADLQRLKAQLEAGA